MLFYNGDSFSICGGDNAIWVQDDLNRVDESGYVRHGILRNQQAWNLFYNGCIQRSKSLKCKVNMKFYFLEGFFKSGESVRLEK